MEKRCVNAGTVLRLLLACLALALCATAYGGGEVGWRLVELDADTLPALTIPRTGHVTLCLDGEVTVLGGHTDGFVPTPTAEYLRDGAWHTVPLAYPHDHGAAVRLRSGKVFLAGGHKEPLGLGQLFSVELYDPETHTSRGFGCMDRKRAFPSAAELSDGQVVIAGNWFADDGIEMFGDVTDPLSANAEGVKDTSLARATPYILRISDDDAIIFGSVDSEGGFADSGVVDRLKGSSYREPFLETWSPIRNIYLQRSLNHFIGDEAEGRYEWLLPVENRETGRVEVARVTGPTGSDTIPRFSVLPTREPLPDSIYGKPVLYSSLVCDRDRGIAYLIGDNDEARIFVFAIPYDTPEAAPLTIYVTAPQSFMARNATPVLTAGGDLVFAGGHLVSNFSPSGAVVRLPLGDADGMSAVQAESGVSLWWLWLLIIVLGACAVAATVAISRRRHKARVSAANETADEIGCEADPESADDTQLGKNPLKEEFLTDTFTRIEQLMRDEKLFLNPNLRVSDVAVRASTNTVYVSAAVNSRRGCSFSQYLASLRIAYAQELMRRDPEEKISTIGTHSGFTTESTFFRAFRAVTGMSPKEWLAANRDSLG